MIIIQRIWNIARLLYCNFERRKYNELQSSYKQKHVERKISINIYYYCNSCIVYVRLKRKTAISRWMTSLKAPQENDVGT